MGIFRVEKSKNFTIMSNYHFREKKMSLKAKGLLSWMLSLPDNWDYSIKGMCKCHKDGEDAITSALKELQSFGYLEVVKLMPGTVIENSDGSIYTLNRIDYDYVIHEKPINPQDTDFQCTENQATENQATENPYQINTKELNTKEPNTNKKGTGTGASSKNHSQVYKKRESLNDDLQSGKDIDKQKSDKKKSPKDKFKDECLDIIDREYSDETKYLLIEYFDFVSSVPEDKDNLCKRVKTVKAWRHKLDRLDDLVKEGYDCRKLIQQSLDKKQYVFYPLQSVQQYKTNHKEGNQENIIVSDPEWAREQIQKAIDNGEEFF